eukprot:1157451-Pelagomonas_calceolata.AAC.10
MSALDYHAAPTLNACLSFLGLPKQRCCGCSGLHETWQARHLSRPGPLALHGWMHKQRKSKQVGERGLRALRPGIPQLPWAAGAAHKCTGAKASKEMSVG